MLRRFYSRFRHIDRYTYYYDSQFNFFTGLYSGMVFALQGLLAQSLGATPFMLAIMCSSIYIGQLLNLLAGHELTKLPKVKYGVKLLMFARTAPILMIFIRDAWGYIAIISVMNLFENLFFSAYRSMQKMNYSKTHRSKAIGEVTNTFSCFYIISSYAAAQIYDINTGLLKITYPLASILGIIAVWRISHLKVRHEKAEPEANSSPDFFSTFRLLKYNRLFLFFIFTIFVLAFGDTIGEPIVPIRLKKELKLSYTDANFATVIVLNIMQIAGLWFWARMSKKRNPRFLLIFAAILYVSRPVTLALAAAPFGLAIGMGIYGLGYSGVNFLAVLVIFDVSHHDSRLSSYLGLFYFLTGIRGLVGPYIGSSMLHHGISTIYIFWMSAAIVAIGILMLILFNVFRERIENGNRLDKITGEVC